MEMADSKELPIGRVRLNTAGQVGCSDLLSGQRLNTITAQLLGVIQGAVNALE